MYIGFIDGINCIDAFDFAVSQNNLELVVACIKGGANPSIGNKYGRAALQTAKIFGNIHIINFLEEHKHKTTELSIMRDEVFISKAESRKRNHSSDNDYDSDLKWQKGTITIQPKRMMKC